MITCYAFQAVPPFAQGLVRDLRVRWALEEVGLPYRITLVGDGAMPRSAYRKIQPFGQRNRLPDRVEAGGIEPPSEGSDPGIPECPAVAKRAESQRWRVRAAPRVTHGFQKIRNVSGTCRRVTPAMHTCREPADISRPGRPAARGRASLKTDTPAAPACRTGWRSASPLVKRDLDPGLRALDTFRLRPTRRRRRRREPRPWQR